MARREERAEETQLLLLEAREIFERLEAEPWVRRLATTRADTGGVGDFYSVLSGGLLNRCGQRHTARLKAYA